VTDTWKDEWELQLVFNLVQIWWVIFKCPCKKKFISNAKYQNHDVICKVILI